MRFKNCWKLLFLLVVTLELFLSQFVLVASKKIEEPLRIEEFKEFKEAGTYPIRIYSNYEGSEAEETVYVTIQFSSTIISEVYNEGIDAQDIKTNKEKIMLYSDSELIQLASAYAWSTKDGQAVDITKVIRIKVSDVLYHVKFITDLGTTAEINVIGYDDIFNNHLYTNIQEENLFLSFSKKLGEMQIILGVFMFIPLILLVILFAKIYRQAKDVEQIFNNYFE